MAKLGVRALVLIATALGVSACDRNARGFALPPGDADRGKAAFVALGCNQCHYIPDIVEKATEGPYPEVSVHLGGSVARVKAYGELVTAIIHPQASLSRGAPPELLDDAGESRMPNYNDVMTVAQLVDITTFLQEQYRVVVPQYAPYWPAY